MMKSFDEEQEGLNDNEMSFLNSNSKTIHFTTHFFHSFHQFISFPFPFSLLLFPIMSIKPQQEINAETSPITQSKSILSNGDVEGAFAVLKEAVLGGNAMACFDAGFMTIQGMGCKRDLKEGTELVRKGCELVKDLKDCCWKENGSVSELFEPQSMNLNGLFLCGFAII